MNDPLNQKDLYLSEKILEAMKFAAEAHKEQLRKEGGPYISHPATVGLILARAGFPEEVIIAGILHDVIEDTSYTYDDINFGFGQSVADLVRWVSYDQNIPAEEGKRIYRKQLAEGPVEACMISTADLLANRTDTLNALKTGKNWHRDLQKVFEYDTSRLAIIKQRLHHPLVDEAEAMVNQVHQFSTK